METVDEWGDEIIEHEAPFTDEMWTGYTDFNIIEEDVPMPTMTRTSRDLIDQEKANVDEQERQEDRPIGDRDGQGGHRDQQTTADDKVEPNEEMSETEEIRREEKRGAIDLDTDSDPGSPKKKCRIEWAELLYNTIEEMIEAKKKKTDVIFDKLPEDRKERFRTAIKKEIDNNSETGAYRPMNREESDAVRRSQPGKILFAVAIRPRRKEHRGRRCCEGPEGRNPS